MSSRKTAGVIWTEGPVSRGHARRTPSWANVPRMHLTRLSPAVLLLCLVMTGCERGSTPPPVAPAPKPQAPPESFLKAGLAAPVTAPGVTDPGEVNVAELRDGLADPRILSEEDLQTLLRSGPRRPPAPTGELEPVEGNPAPVEEARLAEDVALGAAPPPPPPPPSPASAARPMDAAREAPASAGGRAMEAKRREIIQVIRGGGAEAEPAPAKPAMKNGKGH